MRVAASDAARRQGIIWLASYPKSGNTWIRLFLAALRGGAAIDLSLMNGTFAIASDRTMIERQLDLCLADLSWEIAAELRPLAYRAMAEGPGGPLFMKVHDSYGTTPSGADLFPPEASAGCVHLVRDPRDVCLSLAAHNGVAIDKAIASLGQSATATPTASKTQVRECRGSWSSHGESWLASPLRRLTLRYEDLIADPLTHLGAAALFCGLGAAPAAIARAAAATDFATLAALEAATGFRERPPGMARFFRSGKAGQWSGALTPAQIARIEHDHGALMRRLGYPLVTEADRLRERAGPTRSYPDASAETG